MSKMLKLKPFMNRVKAATEEAGIPVQRVEGSYLHLTLSGEIQRLNLKQAYQAYQNSPERLEDIIGTHLSVLQKMPNLPIHPAEPAVDVEAADVILPLLQQEQWLESATPPDAPPLLYQPYVTGLIIAYVLDMPTHRAYVNMEMFGRMEGTGGTLDEVHGFALENMRRQSKEIDYQTFGSLYQTMIVGETHDGYAANSVLLPDLMEKWSRRIPGQMVIGIPNRDFIIAFSDRNPAGVGTIAQQVKRDARRRKHPLLSRLLTWKDGKIRDFQPLN